MKIKKILGGLIPIAAAGLLVYAGAVYSQTEKRVIEAPKEPGVALDRASDKSPQVNLSAIGKEVAPGVMEVDRASIRGKRLMLGGTAKHVCLGKWNDKLKACDGNWIEW